jgi:hypothetical protein
LARSPFIYTVNANALVVFTTWLLRRFIKRQDGNKFYLSGGLQRFRFVMPGSRLSGDVGGEAPSWLWVNILTGKKFVRRASLMKTFTFIAFSLL